MQRDRRERCYKSGHNSGVSMGWNGLVEKGASNGEPIHAGKVSNRYLSSVSPLRSGTKEGKHENKSKKPKLAATFDRHTVFAGIGKSAQDPRTKVDSSLST